MANVSLSGFNASQLLKPLMISILGPPILQFSKISRNSRIWFDLKIGKDTMDDQNPAWKR